MKPKVVISYHPTEKDWSLVIDASHVYGSDCYQMKLTEYGAQLIKKAPSSIYSFSGQEPKKGDSYVCLHCLEEKPLLSLGKSLYDEKCWTV